MAEHFWLNWWYASLLEKNIKGKRWRKLISFYQTNAYVLCKLWETLFSQNLPQCSPRAARKSAVSCSVSYRSWTKWTRMILSDFPLAESLLAFHHDDSWGYKENEMTVKKKATEWKRWQEISNPWAPSELCLFWAEPKVKEPRSFWLKELLLFLLCLCLIHIKAAAIWSNFPFLQFQSNRIIAPLQEKNEVQEGQRF